MQLSELLSLSRSFLDRSHNLKKADILSLREVIVEHNKLYYQDEAPIISDTEYDLLFHTLARLEADHDMLDESSPTAKLAILASSQFQKVKHVYPMISLDNTYNVEEVREWNDRMKRILGKSDKGQMTNDSLEKSLLGKDYQLSTINRKLDFYIQPKYDGLGLAVIYESGKLKQAITRGSGVEGEDVTLTALEIRNIPKEIISLRNVERMEIRGEVMMSRTEFDRVNKERLERGEKLFANPRNCASGSLRQLDPLVTRSRKLQFFAYSIPQIEQAVVPVMSSEAIAELRHLAQENIEEYFSTINIIDTDFLRPKGQIEGYQDMMNLLSSWGFEREDFPFTTVDGIDELANILERETSHPREYFDFDIDGMVLKLDDMTLWDDLGRTEHHPRYAIAYKFPAKQIRTRVISIEHSVGRTGTITPVANLEPVEVTGVVVKRATLHNYDELRKKGVMEGDYVFVMRAGEVIPEIVSVLTELRDGSERNIDIPEICPICATQVKQDEGMVAIYCPSPSCPAKIQGQLEMFVGKQGMNIDGLGTKQIELFLELGWITDFASVFDLFLYREKLLELEGYKEKSVNNLLEALEKARHTTLDRVFVAIGIPNVGKKTGRQLSVISYQLSEKKNISLRETLFTIMEEELLEVKDIGPETARAFVEYMRENREGVERLLSKLEIQIENSAQKTVHTEDSLIMGKSFCVTGSFDTFSRDKIHEMIEKHGGEVRTSVTTKLDYLIIGENAGSKKSKAEDLGVKCISLEEFIAML